MSKEHNNRMNGRKRTSNSGKGGRGGRSLDPLGKDVFNIQEPEFPGEYNSKGYRSREKQAQRIERETICHLHDVDRGSSGLLREEKYESGMGRGETTKGISSDTKTGISEVEHKDSDPFMEIHKEATKENLWELRECVYRDSNNDARSQCHNTPSTEGKSTGIVCGMGGSGESSSDISLSWLQSINASYCGSLPIAIDQEEFDIKYNLEQWSQFYDKNLVEGVAYFEDMGSYLVKAEDGQCYLWDNEMDVLFGLGRTREQVSVKLSLDTIWSDVDAIDPLGNVALATKQKESHNKWLEYFNSMRKFPSNFQTERGLS